MAKLIIECEFDPSTLDWKGPRPHGDDMLENYNEFYRQHPYEAFEIALKDSAFKVISARCEPGVS